MSKYVNRVERWTNFDSITRITTVGNRAMLKELNTAKNDVLSIPTYLAYKHLIDFLRANHLKTLIPQSLKPISAYSNYIH